jgi:hypothetical protein
MLEGHRQKAERSDRKMPGGRDWKVVGQSNRITPVCRFARLIEYDDTMRVVRPQITMPSLLLSTALLSAGIGLSLIVIDRWLSGERTIPPGGYGVFNKIQFFAAGAFTGAGLLAPFGRLRVGAYVGIMIAVGWCLGLRIYLGGWQSSWQIPNFTVAFALASAVVAIAGATLLRKVWLSAWDNQKS